METGRIRFGDIEIDPRTREILHGAEPISVQRKVFDLILYLIEHRDRAVGKDELQERVWPGVIVTETALTRAVMKARRAVGDDSERQAVIRTVHGHGYRFVAEPVALPARSATGESAPATGAPNGHRSPGSRPWAAAGAIALVALVGVAALLTLRPGSPESTRIAVLPIEDRTGQPDMGWVSLGLMSYTSRLVSEGSGIETVSPRRMMTAMEAIRGEPADEALQQLRRSLSASHLLYAVLARDGDGLMLDYRVVHAHGTGPVASIAGQDPTVMAQAMARAVISGLPGSGLRRGFRTVSEDPFVNEAYARGLSLNLQGEVAKARDYFEVAVRQEPDLFWPRYELALTLRDTGELALARDNLETLVNLNDAGDSAEMRAAARNALAQVLWRQQEYDAAATEYKNALATARELADPALEAVILVNMGILARITGDLELARARLAAALEAANRGDDPDLGAIYQSLGQVEWAAGRLPLAMDYYRRAHDAFQANGNLRGQAASINAMARVKRRQGDYSAAEALMLDTLRQRADLGDYFGRVSSHASLAELYWESERWMEALEHADTALRLAEEAQHRGGVAEALEIRAGIALSMGDAATARPDLQRIEADHPEALDSFRFRILNARLAMSGGRIDEGRRLLHEVMDDGPALARIDALDALATSASDVEVARQFWEQALDLARSEQENGRAGRLLVAMARRELSEGNRDAARSRLEQLSAEFPEWRQVEELGERVDLSRAEL